MIYNKTNMEYLQNVVEYYDELYPVSDMQKDFYETLKQTFQKPVKFLQIGCGTGAFEHVLSKDGSDVTGLEISKELIEAANLRRRTQLSAIRFFQLSTLDMTRFLGKGFYNVISCLNSRILFIHDQTLLRKFFYDSHTLLTENGVLVLELFNFHSVPVHSRIDFPDRQSIRVKMTTTLMPAADGKLMNLTEKVETGNGRILPVMQNEAVYPLTKEEIETFGKEAGYREFTFYSGYDKKVYDPSGADIVAVLK